MTTKNYFSKPSSWAKRGAAAVILAGTVALLGSCGGSGVSSDTGVQVGALTLLPASGTLFANVPFTFTIAGGSRPYTVTTSEQTLIAPLTVNSNTFTVVPNNPGVVDPQTDPLIIPSRSIRFTIRDNAGAQVVTGDTSFRVVQNFITGYNLTLSAGTTCGVSAGGSATPTVAQACTGFLSTIDLRPTTAGVFYNNRPLRFSINYGEFKFVDKNNGDAIVDTITLTTSGATAPGGTESGNLRAFFAPNSGARAQYASLRITDVRSGVYRDVDFFISAPPATALSISPTSIGPIAGRDSATCGNGQVNVRITGGTPPYVIQVPAALSSTVFVSPSRVDDQNGLFQVGVGASAAPNCVSEPNAVTVRDSTGQAASFGVSTTVGTGPAFQPLNVAPSAIACLADGGIATLAVLGGNSLKVINSSSNLVAVAPPTVTGNGTVTLTGFGAGPVAPAAGAAVTVTVTDGATAFPVSVIRRSVCP